MNETNHPSSLATCTLIQDFLGVKDGGIYEAVVKQKQQLDAVVAECAHVKDISNWSLKTGMTASRDAFHVGCDAEDCLHDAVHTMLKHLTTPNVTAALAEVEAKAIEKGIERITIIMNHQAPAVAQVINTLQMYAKVLREAR